MTPARAVFLDRDGVLIRDVHLITLPDQIEWLPGVPSALQALEQAGYALVIVSNQAVVARGLASETQVDQVNQAIVQYLESVGVELDKVYYCPHHPNADVAEYRRDCECRKPRAGMLLRAQHDLGISLEGSYMVGDHLSDIAAGQQVGCVTIMVDRGEESWRRIESPLWDELPSIQPDYVVDGLPEAAEYILGTARDTSQ